VTPARARVYLVGRPTKVYERRFGHSKAEPGLNRPRAKMSLRLKR